MLLSRAISLVLLILVTFSATHVVERRYTDGNTRSRDRTRLVDNQLVDISDSDYDNDYDLERNSLSYYYKSDSEEGSDADAQTDDGEDSDNDNEYMGPFPVLQHKSNTPSNLLSRRDPKHKEKDFFIQNHACGVHVVQKYFSRNIFSYRVFGPYAWNYQQLIRGPRAERRPFPVSIPLPMLPGKMNMTITVDRDESMYPFANVYFEYGADLWKSSDGRCKVGGYDRNLADLNWNERRIDCSFSCL